MICLMTECRTRHAAPGELQIQVAAKENRVSMALAGPEGWPRRQDSRAGYLARAVCLSFPLVLWWCWDLCGLWNTLCLCFWSCVCFLGFQPSLINESAPCHPSSCISQSTFTSCCGSSPDQVEPGPLALQGWWDLPPGSESHVLCVSLTTHQAFDSVPFPACCITSNQMGSSDEVWRLRVCVRLPGLCVGNSRGIRLTAPGRGGRGWELSE